MSAIEMVDEVLPSGTKTGRIISRNEAHGNGLWHKTVHVWVQNRRGELLLQKRAATKESHPDMWDISSAGHISSGDSSRNAAVREMREELGISIEANALCYICSLPQQCVCADTTFKDNEITDIYMYMFPVEMEEISFCTEEVSDVQFFSINALKKNIVEHRNAFVPHDEEYRRLFEFLEKQEQLQQPGGNYA